jgi:hypothetical protein
VNSDIVKGGGRLVVLAEGIAAKYGESSKNQG